MSSHCLDFKSRVFKNQEVTNPIKDIIRYKENSIAIWTNYSNNKAELTDAVKASLTFKLHGLSQLFFSLMATSKFAVLMLLRPLKDIAFFQPKEFSKSFLMNRDKCWDQITLCGSVFAATFNLDIGLFSDASMRSYTDRLYKEILEVQLTEKKVVCKELLNLSKVLYSAADKLLMLAEEDETRQFDRQALSDLRTRLTLSFDKDSIDFHDLAQMHMGFVTEYNSARQASFQKGLFSVDEETFENYKKAIASYSSAVELMVASSSLCESNSSIFAKAQKCFKARSPEDSLATVLTKSLQKLKSNNQTINTKLLQARSDILKVCNAVLGDIVLLADRYVFNHQMSIEFSEPLGITLTNLTTVLESVNYCLSVSNKEKLPLLNSQSEREQYSLSYNEHYPMLLEDKLRAQYLNIVNSSRDFILNTCRSIYREIGSEESRSLCDNLVGFINLVNKFEGQLNQFRGFFQGSEMVSVTDFSSVVTFVERVKTAHKRVSSFDTESLTESLYEKIKESMSSQVEICLKTFKASSRKLHLAGRNYEATKAQGQSDQEEEVDKEDCIASLTAQTLIDSMPYWRLPFDIDTLAFQDVFMGLNFNNDSDIEATATAGAGVGAGAGINEEVRTEAKLEEQIARKLLEKHIEDVAQYFKPIIEGPESVTSGNSTHEDLVLTSAIHPKDDDGYYTFRFKHIATVYDFVKSSSFQSNLDMEGVDSETRTLYDSYLEARFQFDLSAANLISACIVAGNFSRISRADMKVKESAAHAAREKLSSDLSSLIKIFE